jgi:hypothetical protein
VLRTLSLSALLDLTPAQTRAKGFILWTPSFCSDEAPPSTRQDLAALDPPLYSKASAAFAVFCLHRPL